MPGEGKGLAHKSAAKIGWIGHAGGKASLRQKLGNRTEVAAYTFHTLAQPVCVNILQCGQVGNFLQFNTGDMAVGITGAEKNPQGTAAGAQIQNLCRFWKPHKITENHGVRAQWKSAWGRI